MMGVGMSEMVIILVIALVIFGAGKLPEIGTSLGKGIRNFKKAADGEPPSEPRTLPAQEPPKPAAEAADGEDEKQANP